MGRARNRHRVWREAMGETLAGGTRTRAPHHVTLPYFLYIENII